MLSLLLVQASPGAGMGIESLKSCNCTFYMLDFAELASTAGVSGRSNAVSTWDEAGVCLCLLHCSPVSARYHNFAQPYVRARPSPLEMHASFEPTCCLGVSCQTALFDALGRCVGSCCGHENHTCSDAAWPRNRVLGTNPFKLPHVQACQSAT